MRRRSSAAFACIRAGISSEKSSRSRSGILFQIHSLVRLPARRKRSKSSKGVLSNRCRQSAMRAVAQRHGCGALAGTEEHLFGLRRRVLQRRKAGALVAAVAERLACGLAAGAPPIFLARLDLDWNRRSAAYRRLLAHVTLPLRYEPRLRRRLLPVRAPA